MRSGISPQDRTCLKNIRALLELGVRVRALGWRGLASGCGIVTVRWKLRNLLLVRQSWDTSQLLNQLKCSLRLGWRIRTSCSGRLNPAFAYVYTLRSMGKTFVPTEPQDDSSRFLSVYGGARQKDLIQGEGQTLAIKLILQICSHMTANNNCEEKKLYPLRKRAIRDRHQKVSTLHKRWRRFLPSSRGRTMGRAAPHAKISASAL